MKTNTKTTKEKHAKIESNLGFKNGMLGKFGSMKQANTNKGKGNQKRKT